MLSAVSQITSGLYQILSFFTYQQHSTSNLKQQGHGLPDSGPSLSFTSERGRKKETEHLNQKHLLQTTHERFQLSIALFFWFPHKATKQTLFAANTGLALGLLWSSSRSPSLQRLQRAAVCIGHRQKNIVNTFPASAEWNTQLIVSPWIPGRGGQSTHYFILPDHTFA